MRRSHLLLASAAAFAATPGHAVLLISQYVEGSSFNKAVEIVNNGAAPHALGAGDELRFYFNGSGTAGTTIALSGGTLNPGQTWVVADDGASAGILAVTDQTSTSNFFSGDDAIELYQGGALTDSLGQVGNDPGSQWGAGLLSTQNNTLALTTLPATGTGGDTNSGDTTDLSRFTGFANDDITGLGDDFSVGPPPPPPPPLEQPVVINEFVFNHTGSDSNEFVEVYGKPGADYSSLSLLEIEGDGSGAGTIDGVWNLGTADDDGLWTTPFLSNAIENGSVSLLLVEDFTGGASDIDTDNDGTIDVMPWTTIIDSIAVSDGDGSDQTYGAVTLLQGYDGVSFTVGGAARAHDGFDTDSLSDWLRVDFSTVPALGTPQNGWISSPFLPTPGGFNIPEPSRAVLFALGMFGLIARRRR